MAQNENELKKYQLKQVVVELTSRCNLNCLHCGSDCKPGKNGKEISPRRWKKIIDELSEIGVEKIHFSGGEPTLKEGFLEIIAHAQKKLKFSLITNGLSLSTQTFELLEEIKPFAVGVSLDGIKDVHNQIRRNAASWSQALKAIMELKGRQIQICAITTVNKMNFDDLATLARVLYLLGVDSWQLQLHMPFGRGKTNKDQLCIDQEIFRKVCLDVITLRERYPSVNIAAADCFGWAPEGLIRPQPWGGCGAGFVGCGIDSAGNILPCLSLKSGFKKPPSLKITSISNIWDHSTIFDFNRKFNPEAVEGDCRNCEKLEICRGGCASQSYSYFNRYHASPFCFFRTFLKD